GGAQVFGCLFGAFCPGLCFLAGDIPRHVRCPVFRFHLVAEWGETTVVGRAEPLFWDVFRGEQKIIANFLRRLDARVLWVGYADEADLRDAVRIRPAVLTDELVDALLVLFA